VVRVWADVMYFFTGCPGSKLSLSHCPAAPTLSTRRRGKNTQHMTHGTWWCVWYVGEWGWGGRLSRPVRPLRGRRAVDGSSHPARHRQQGPCSEEEVVGVKERLAPTGVCTFAAASLGRATAARRWLRSGGMNPLGPYFFFEPFMSWLLFSCVPHATTQKKNYKSAPLFSWMLFTESNAGCTKEETGWLVCLALFYVQLIDVWFGARYKGGGGGVH